MIPEYVVTLSGDEAADHDSIKRACILLLPAWHHLTTHNLSVSPISGGISNLLVKVYVSPSGDHPQVPPVALKAFGPRTELLVDRSREMRTLRRLNASGFGAKVLASFANGRIEEFLEAKTLLPTEMCSPDYIPLIARTIRRFHSIKSDGEEKSRPILWETISSWFNMARSLSFDDPAKQEAYSRLDFQSMGREIAELKSICDAVPSPVVFAHNDLLSGNFLILQGDSSMQLIDFEYSAVGYRGFDLGNHFAEWAGFECDYSRYPDSTAQHDFFRHYLSGDGEGTKADLSEDLLLDMEAEVNVFSLASHIYWGVWAIIQARWSPIDFDYLTYSKTRWAEYHRQRKRFVDAARGRFGSTPRPFTVIAHRGNSHEAPELTFDAFDSGLEFTPALELDVQMTADGVVIVLHDEELGRTNNGKLGQKVSETKYEEMHNLDAGSWFQGSINGEGSFSHCRIPSLLEVLGKYRHRAHIHIELKSEQQGLPNAVCEILKSSGWIEDLTASQSDDLNLDCTPGITITSFHLDQLKASLRLLPSIIHGWLVQSLDDLVFDEAREAGIRQLCPRINAVEKDMVERAKELGFMVRGWGVKNVSLLLQARELGMQGATVDWPRRGLELLRQA